MLFRAGLVACLWLSALVAAAAIDSRGILPIPPSLDPFYQPPTGVESAAPGSILRKRKAALDKSTKQCTFANVVSWPFQSTLSSKFSSAGTNLLRVEPVASVLKQCVLGVDKELTPSAPMPLVHSQHNKLVLVQPFEFTRDAWCANGADISWLNMANGGHVTGAVVPLPQVLEFVHNAFSGTIAKGCSQKTILANKLDPLAFGVALEPVAIAIINWFGKMGADDEGWIQSIKDGKPIH